MDASRFYMQLVSPADAEEIMHLEAVIFTKQNAVINRVGISPESFERVARRDAKGFEKSGLSLAMRDREADGKIIAFLLGHNFATSQSPSWEEVKRLSRIYPLAWDFAMIYVLTIMRAYFLNWSLLWVAMQHRVARVAAGGTASGYEGLGLQGQLRREFIQLAQNQGYDRIVVETISPVTRHLWKKLGFKEQGFKSWESRIHQDGSIPFKGVEGGTTIHELILTRRPLWNLMTFLFASGCVVATLAASKLMFLR